MATIGVGIGAAVGLRYGVQPLPNRPGDLATITDLFDRIATAQGGRADTPGNWPADRAALIAELATQIYTFQTTNNMATVDGAIDPGGGTLRLMNQLASDPPLGATVASAPGPYDQNYRSVSPWFAAPASLDGSDPLMPTQQQTEYSRRLICVTGSSIRWFGVVLPTSVGDTASSARPLIFFTPTPNQHPCDDRDYFSFAGGWPSLWDDYTDRIGGLLCASGVNQILVLPFYQTGQTYNLGAFMSDWQDVVVAVINAAVTDINPYYLSGTYSFSSIASASFSNGVGVHQRFNSGARGAQAMTSVLFDLDGGAQTGGSHWAPRGGIIYRNLPPQGANPQGSRWFVGGRWSLFDRFVDPLTSQYSHHACSQYLLTHGLSLFGG